MTKPYRCKQNFHIFTGTAGIRTMDDRFLLQLKIIIIYNNNNDNQFKG